MRTMWSIGALALLLAGCGGGGGPHLKISAAASLERAFTQYAHQFSSSRVSFSFAGSDTLAAQIEQGIRPDVFASANTQLPDALFAKGLVDRPVVFVANRLVLAVPASSKITRLAGLMRTGVTISVGTPTVPVGAYTARVFARLPSTERERLLANVRDREPDVTGIVGKLTEGAVDAGFLYATDVAATKGRLRSIELPTVLQPEVLYEAAVVKGTRRLAQARSFIAGLIDGAGRRDLLRDGFLTPAVP